MVLRHSCKVDIAGSNPVGGLRDCSSVVEQFSHKESVAGSIPVSHIMSQWPNG